MQSSDRKYIGCSLLLRIFYLCVPLHIRIRTYARAGNCKKKLVRWKGYHKVDNLTSKVTYSQSILTDDRSYCCTLWWWNTRFKIFRVYNTKHKISIFEPTLTRLVSHTHTHTIDVIVDVRMTSRDVIVGIRMTSLPVYGHREWYTGLIITDIPCEVTGQTGFNSNSGIRSEANLEKLLKFWANTQK